MFFGEVPVSEAEGAVLAHSVTLPGAKFRKGRVLSADDVAALGKAGLAGVTVARHDPDDVAEDEAARRAAAPLVTATMTVSEPFTGRVNLFAAVDGLVTIDRAAIDRLNAIDEAVTIATLAPDSVVTRGQMIATIKIIPFAAPEAAVAAWEAAASEARLLDVAGFRQPRAGMVLSGTDGLKPSVVEKTIRATRDRLAVSGGDLVEIAKTDHAIDDVAGEIRRLADMGCELILASGVSAIVDRRDVIPAAIVAAGGEIVHFGMPVDPGNLILLAKIGETAVIGLPGCARSPKLNGFDWILQRCAAGLDVTRADVMRMGAGGLLQEGSRPMPRERTKQLAPPGRKKIAALVLAAGQSRRMGGENKLLKHFDGEPLVARTVREIARTKVEEVIVVTGHQSAEVAAALDGTGARIIHADDYALGLSASLRAGLDALPEGIDGIVICLADMPFLAAKHVDRLIAAFDPVEGREICVPTRNGKRGNPVVWSMRFAGEMKAIRGDTGARHLIGENEDVVVEVAMEDDGILVDLDSPEAWKAAGRG
jgi:molybdenum cofactor cytidylyltransferase